MAKTLDTINTVLSVAGTVAVTALVAYHMPALVPVLWSDTTVNVIIKK